MLSFLATYWYVFILTAAAAYIAGFFHCGGALMMENEMIIHESPASFFVRTIVDIVLLPINSILIYGLTFQPVPFAVGMAHAVILPLGILGFFLQLAL